MKGRSKVSRFNLIDEPWISVMVNLSGETKEVSLKELFTNAHQYVQLAGDTKTQDFAVFRVLLAILHTVFSRVDADGEAYEYVTLDDNFRVVDIEENPRVKLMYEKELMDTWQELWNSGRFPEIINLYLQQWHERFYLFDEMYPFYQVTEQVVSADNINKARPSVISGKNINRQISESGNKTALFSPKYSAKNNKEKLTEAEIARWLITFQGYTGLSDKVIFGKEKYDVSNSKGWLFDLGGIYLEGDNLFETLLLNLVLNHPVDEYKSLQQKPAWEFSGEEVVNRLLKQEPVRNLAELYTNWSRAIYIDPSTDIADAFQLSIVKLPEIKHQNQFLEPMTLWRFNRTGTNKETFTPRKHTFQQAMWRSFGLISLPDDDSENQRRPKIMDWYRTVKPFIGDRRVVINTVSMQDDGNATSWVPTNEIIDRMNVEDFIIDDDKPEGWLYRVDSIVSETQQMINIHYRNFLRDIVQIRGLDGKNDYIPQSIAKIYEAVDRPFREWLEGIGTGDSMDEKTFEWRETLFTILTNETNRIIDNATYRDYRGVTIKDGTRILNIVTAHNRLIYHLRKELKMKEADYE